MSKKKRRGGIKPSSGFGGGIKPPSGFGGGIRLPSGFGGGMPAGDMDDMQEMSALNVGNMVTQLQKMQQDMQEAQATLENEIVEVSIGGGALKIVITGHQRVQSITLNPDVVDPSDPEWVTDLQDLLVAGINQAIEQSQTMAAEKMERVAGGLGDIPGLDKLLG